MNNVQTYFQEMEDQFGQLFHRRYGMVEHVDCEDAEIIMITTGTVSRAGRQAVHSLRRKGEKAGLLKIRLLQPFPADSVRAAVESAQKIAVVQGPLLPEEQNLLAGEVASALEGVPCPPSVYGYVTGNGGYSVTAGMMQEIYLRTKYHTGPQKENVGICLS